MGTPDFACPALLKLINDPNFELVAVYTREPKIAGRGHKITNSPVHQLALQNQLPVFTPKTLKDKQIQEDFFKLRADMVVVVAYGLILPIPILQATSHGCINIHPSILPRWRGAAPMQRAIMAGDNKTGVAIMKMDEGLDSGDVLAQVEFVIDEEITYQELAKKSSIIGADLLIKTLYQIKNGQLQSTKQDHNKAIYAPKIDKSEALIDWHKSALEVNRQIRALNGSLAAHFSLNGENIKIYQAEVLENNSISNLKPGSIIDQKMTIQCKIGTIRPQILQRSGKKVMSLAEFLNGFTYVKNHL